MIDYYDLNTDWIKTKWSLPAYKSKAFFDYLEATKNTLDRFKKQQVYLAATESGLIVDDEWTNNQSLGDLNQN